MNVIYFCADIPNQIQFLHYSKLLEIHFLIHQHLVWNSEELNIMLLNINVWTIPY